MSRRSISEEEQPFAVATANTTAGAAKRVERFDIANAAVHFHSFDGGSPGSYDLEGTLDGNVWEKIDSAVTSAEVIPLTHYWRALRVYTTTAGSTPPTVVLGAHEFLY